MKWSLKAPVLKAWFQLFEPVILGYWALGALAPLLS